MEFIIDLIVLILFIFIIKRLYALLFHNKYRSKFGNTKEAFQLLNECKNLPFQGFSERGKLTKEVIDLYISTLKKFENYLAEGKIENIEAVRICMSNLEQAIYVSVNHLDLSCYTRFNDHKEFINRKEKLTLKFLDMVYQESLVISEQDIKRIASNLDYLCCQIIKTKSKKHLRQLQRFSKCHCPIIRLTANHPLKDIYS